MVKYNWSSTQIFQVLWIKYKYKYFAFSAIKYSSTSSTDISSTSSSTYLNRSRYSKSTPRRHRNGQIDRRILHGMPGGWSILYWASVWASNINLISLCRRFNHHGLSSGNDHCIQLPGYERGGFLTVLLLIHACLKADFSDGPMQLKITICPGLEKPSN